jgi:hypothetical protein
VATRRKIHVCLGIGRVIGGTDGWAFGVLKRDWIDVLKN